ncbi:MAG: hypothetical protein GF409_03355 [Candidatus Omnitrophica bacterium]|nr:hypothetical protein [Candidatus Omnitrophota bacterium]
MKKVLILFVIFVIAFNVNAFASRNEPLKNIGDGLDEIVYGQIETPDSIDETGTKGSPAYSDCTAKTNDDVGRGIARFVGGIWRIATFWYPEDDTSSMTTK